VTIKHSKVLENDTIYAQLNYSDIDCINKKFGIMDGLNFQNGFHSKTNPGNKDNSIEERGF
jgi:hypothetical protein